MEEYIGTYYLSVIAEIAGEGDSITECAIHLLKKENADEEFIDEFRAQFAEKRSAVPNADHP